MSKRRPACSRTRVVPSRKLERWDRRRTLDVSMEMSFPSMSFLAFASHSSRSTPFLLDLYKYISNRVV